MATVAQRRGIWYINYSHGGKYHRRPLGKITESEAREVLAEFNRGRPPVAESMLVKLSPAEISRLFWRSIERARERDIPHRLLREDVADLYAQSEGRCAVSGIQFSREKPMGCTKRPWWVSIDRIDSKGIYVKDNCRLVCVAVNIAMGEWGEKTLRQIARAVVYGRPV